MDHHLEDPTIQKSLDPSYLLGEKLPFTSGENQFYRVYRHSQKAETLQLCFAEHHPEAPAALVAQWEQTLRSYTQSPSPMLCSKLDHRVHGAFHWIISEFAGETSLEELAQSPKGLKLDEIEAFIRLLSTTCEAAVQVLWPQLDLHPERIFLNSRMGLPRLPYPPLEELQRVGPTHVDAYTRDLAVLCASLLGCHTLDSNSLSQHPRLTPKQRRVMSMAVDEFEFPLEEFLSEFFDPRETTHQQWMAETMWNMTVQLPKLSATEKQRVQTPPTKHHFTYSIDHQPTFLPQEAAQSENAYSKIGWMKVRAEDLGKTQDTTAYSKVRLIPLNEDTPVLSITSESKVSMGRATMYCDYVTQFRPRSEMNDSRTLKISRHQTLAEWRRNALFIRDTQATNPSTYQFLPVPKDGLLLKLPFQLSLAGEYPLEILHLPSDFSKPPTVEGFETTERPETRGALVFRACGAGVFLTETCLLFSDITLHFSQSGKAWFKGASDWEYAFARIHRWGSSFWLEALQAKAVHLIDKESQEIRLNELVHLSPGRKLKLGSYTYQVESYHLETLP